MKCTAKKIGINGEGIAYLDRIPVFVEGLLPEETAEIELIEQRERYARGRVVQRLSDSPFRQTPACPVQSRCSGCPFMILSPEAQLKAKRELVKEALIKYAGLRGDCVEAVQPSPKETGYRNQCKLPVKMDKGRLISGLYEEGSNRMIPVNSCLIHDPELEAMRKRVMKVLNDQRIRDYDPKTQKGLRTLVLRGFDGHFQGVLVTGASAVPPDCVEALRQVPGLDCLMQNVNPDRKARSLFSDRWRLLFGEDRLTVDLDGITLQLSCASFFQLNLLQAISLYRFAASLIENCGTLVEAYSGVGGISLMMKDKAREIIGIESVREAVENANLNAKLNHADHVRFVCGDAAQEMKKILKEKQLDVVVVDPPRSGLDEAMLESLRSCRPRQILYISCNPATLGKNLKVLGDLYRVERVVPFDMFPNTPHIETVVLLIRKF